MRNIPPHRRRGPEFLLLALVSLVTGLFGWHFSSGRAMPSSRSFSSAPDARSAQTGTILTATQPQRRLPSKDAPFSKRAAFDRLVAQAEPEEHLEELFTQLQELSSEEFPMAIADLMGRKNYKASNLAALVAGYWTERDLEGARAWMLKMPFESGHYGEFEQEILGAWGRMDPLGMFDWLQAHTSEIQPSRKGDVAYALCTLGPSTAPERALKWLHAHQPDRVDFLYLRWALRDGPSAAASALTETDPTIRNAAICTAAEWWARSAGDVSAPAEWAKKLSDPVVSSKALLGIGWTLWSRNQLATADYFVGLPQTNDIRGALKRVAMDWKDLPAALRWSLVLEDDELAEWLLPSLLAREGAAEKIGEVMKSLPEEKRTAAHERWARVQPVPASMTSPEK